MAERLRIVSFNVYPMAYWLVADWARRRGHRIVLVVTSSSPRGERYGEGHRELVAGLPPEQDVLVTTRMRRTAAPVIAALQPDLILSATFPQRIPSEVTAIPRYGAVNLHPAPLPRGRGPNPQRLIFEGDMMAGATLHRIVPEFDAGAILSQRLRQLPDDVTSDVVMATWLELLNEALDEGVARAAAGEPGEEQDDSLASYAAPFTEEERWLCWDEPALTIQRRGTALNLAGATARAVIAGQPVVIREVRAQPSMAASAADAPGTVLGHNEGAYLISTGEGVVEVSAEALPS